MTKRFRIFVIFDSDLFGFRDSDFEFTLIKRGFMAMALLNQ